MATASYSTFKTSQCSWQAIFSMLVRPELLWECWAPQSLGSYADVKALWETWDEGASVRGIGRGPPLRLVESESARREDQRAGKGKLPAWRPHNNEQVSVRKIDDDDEWHTETSPCRHGSASLPSRRLSPRSSRRS